ncbi:MAG: PAS domain-containing sensor histidine kinase [Cyanobacteria bacterium P01_G01_bin.54]
MSKYLDIFDHKLEQAHHQFEGLVQQIDQAPEPSALLKKAREELFTALEEVHVLLEELTAQHEQIETAQLILQTEHQQYFELFDLAPDGYLVTNIEGVIWQVNQVAATLLNRRQDLLVGKPIAALMAQFSLREFYTMLSRLQQGDPLQNVTFCLKPHQRPPLYASFTIAPVCDHQGQLIGFRWLFRDLTEQRQAILALEESEAQYRAIVEDQTELICRSLADGRITFVNRAFGQYFERSSESLMGENFFNLVLEADQEQVMRRLASLDHDTPVITFEHRVRLDDGQIRWQQWTHRALFDREGNFFQFQSAGRDITAQKRAEEALHQREAQLRLVTDALPVLIAHVDAKQRLIYSNRTHEHWFGQPEDFTGRYLWEILGPTHYQQIRIPVDQALMGEYVTFEQAVVFPNSAPFWIQAILVPDKSAQDEVKGFFALINDISDRKAIETQKDQLISIASHELRTPLTAIHGALQLLTRGQIDPLSAAGQKLLTMAANSGERMVEFVNDLLDFQRIELGKMPLACRDCDVDEVIQGAFETLQIMSQDHHVTLAVPHCIATIWADPARIIQVLTNLISNAIKASPVGGTVWITAEPDQDPFFQTMRPPIKFQVQDQGPGIPPEHLPHIFEVFYQADTADLHLPDFHHRGDTGLGLAICRGIIEQHGGHITVNSIVGEGTTVSFTLPAPTKLL